MNGLAAAHAACLTLIVHNARPAKSQERERNGRKEGGKSEIP